jgi:hypothetical protein
MNIRLTEHFSLEELIRSDYAEEHNIDNTPSPLAISNLIELSENILEPLRVSIGSPIITLSGFRCLEVNRGIGSSDTSQHIAGEAADIIVKGMTITSLFNFIIKSGLPYDQLIHEFGKWVHVSYSARNRRQKLVAIKDGENKTKYLPFHGEVYA